MAAVTEGTAAPGDTPEVPTLAEWMGGIERFHALTAAFYAKVPDDDILAPVFAGMDPAHAEHVAAFLCETFGGETAYTAVGGSHAGMVRRHLRRQLSEAQRRRWVTLMLETADEVSLPDDPEFRAALVGYLEWGTRIAVINSQEGVPEPEPDSPMPRWGWGPPGGPWDPGEQAG